MSEVTNELVDHVDCPICGSEEAISRQTIEPPQEQINCYKCGYLRDFYVTNLADKDKVSEFEWVPRYQIKEQLGYGGYKLQLNHSNVAEIGSFATGGSLPYFLSEVDRLIDQVTYASYTELVDGQIKQTVVVDKPNPNPHLY